MAKVQPLIGQLDETQIPYVLHNCYLNRTSGVLVVHRDKHVRQIAFMAGEVRSARSNRLEQRLGQYLMRVNAIDRIQLMRALSRGAPEGPIGRRLVSMGFIGEDHLAGYLEGLVREIVFETCEWGRGEYRLYKGKPPLPEENVIPVSTVDLVFKGFKDFASVELAKQVIGDMHAPLHIGPRMSEVLKSLSLSGQDTAVLMLVNGSTSAERLLNEVPGGPESNLIILGSLIACGLVNVAGQPDVELMQELLQKQAQASAVHVEESDEKEEPEEEQPLPPPKPNPVERPVLSDRDVNLFRKTIHEKYALLSRNPTHYEVLGIPIRATLKEVRTAFSHLEVMCDPELRKSGPLADLAKKMEAVEERAEEAFRVLGNTDSRKKYNLRKGYPNRW
jgi:hypothetical protein